MQPNASVGEQFKLNRPGRVRLTYNYSYSDTDHFYFHEHRQHAVERATLATSLLNEHLAILEVDATARLSGVLEVPFLYGRQTRSGPGSLAVNGAMVGAGLGDVRVGARFWILDKECALRLYGLAGVRLPTGASDEKFTSQAGRRVDKDVSVQPGTGNLAGYLELGGTYDVKDAPLGLFFQGRYTFAPATHTRARNFRNQLSGAGYKYNSDPDSASWKAGVVLSLGKAIREQVSDEASPLVDGFAMLFSVGGAHVPYDDIFGGNSGFRRGANIFFVEPGIVWAFNDRVTWSLSSPITVYKYVTRNGGNVPEFIVQTGLTIALN
ncbi:MAG: hypothetical protein KDD82_04660 [Planctomycetes bacterium]|nr:hypothetical protein [Planctomycetota bacterium]